MKFRAREFMEPADQPPKLSLVVPFYNEEDSVTWVVDEIGRELTALEIPWEAIWVDDGSTDRTGERLEGAVRRWPMSRYLRHPKNLGQGPALYSGICRARAAVVATMDGDGQNHPGDLSALLSRLEGADLVVGVRVSRHDSRLRRILSRVANTARGQLLRDGVRDAGCALKVFRRDVIAAFFPLPMLNPFMPALAAAAGFRVAEHPVRHRARSAGRSKYGGTALFFRPLGQLIAVWWMLRRARPPGAAIPSAARL